MARISLYDDKTTSLHFVTEAIVVEGQRGYQYVTEDGTVHIVADASGVHLNINRNLPLPGDVNELCVTLREAGYRAHWFATGSKD